nr:deoxycytidine triphosphate deaminase [uncultured bacterium]
MNKPTSNHAGTLVKDEILEYIKQEKLRFTPALDTFQVQSHSIDLRLGYTFMVPKLWGLTEKGREAFFIDYLDDRQRFEVIELENEQFFDLLPKESVVASTLEEVALPNDLMAVLYPRSSVNRKGLAVDLSGIVDAGYEGRLLIPITNNTSSQVIRIYPGERICQLVFYPLSRAIETERSRWHKSDVPVGRRSEKKKVEETLIAKGHIRELKTKYALLKDEE